MKIKKISSKIAQAIVLISFIYAGSVSPILSLRFNNVAGQTDMPSPDQAIGLRMLVGDEGVYSGFDTNGDGDFRIFVQQSFGSFGIGTNDLGDPQFTIGGQYSVLDNLSISLDYVVNRLTVDPGAAVAGDPFDDEMRVSLSITF